MIKGPPLESKNVLNSRLVLDYEATRLLRKLNSVQKCLLESDFCELVRWPPVPSYDPWAPIHTDAIVDLSRIGVRNHGIREFRVFLVHCSVLREKNSVALRAQG